MTTIRLATVMAAGLFMIATAKAGVVNSLSDLQWEKRIILVVDPENRSETIDRLGRFRDGVRERHIAWFVMTGDELESNIAGLGPALSQSVRDRLERSSTQQQVVLIGKDGGVKDRSNELDLERIFALIDAMPMRMREMRQNDQ